ncbi:MAG: helix-turn-helix domain-containing protein [Bacillota bacterium]
MKMERTKLSEQIRKAIEKSGLSGYRIAKETGISQSMISVFMSGKGMLSMKFLDRVADLIGLNITLGISENEKGANLRAAQITAGQNGGNGGVVTASADVVPAASQSTTEPQAAVQQSCEGAAMVEAHEQQ